MPSQVEIQGVNSAVEHLQELGDRMVHDYGFSDRDVNNIDKVIEALKELETLRHEAHERLEAETIRASVKRHKLQFLPQLIRQEIKDAVESARKSNAAALAALKKQLEDINKNIIYLEDYQKQLDEENAELHPERELIRQQHEEIISQLNQRMAEKASMQILLNETRDKVRQTNQEIVDLEDGILQLKEDLIQERGEARNEKRQLKKAVASTSDKTKEQKLLNVEKKKELDTLHEQLVESEGKLDALRKSLRRYETSKAKLEGQQRALEAQLNKQLKQNADLSRKGAAIENEDMLFQSTFEENEKQLSEKVKKMESEIKQQAERYEELDKKRLESADELQEKLDVKSQDAERVEAMDEQLQAEKRHLAFKAEEVGRMQGENVDMQEQIEELAESHKAMETELSHRQSIRTPTPPGLTEEQRAMLESASEEERAAVLAQLNQQIEAYREQLARERKERTEIQQRKNSVSKELEDYKIENTKFMQEMNNTITTGKSEHITLSNEEIEKLEKEKEEHERLGAQLQKELREDDKEINELEADLDREQKQYTEVFTKMQNEVDTMEREIMDMETSIAEKKQKVEEITPEFEELEKSFEARSDAYEKQKKEIVELKGKKSHLEEQIRKVKDKKEKMKDPMAKLRHELKQKRHEVLFQIKHHGEDTKNIESEIYVSGCKLKTIMDENARFEEACQQFTNDIDGLSNQMDYNEILKKHLLQELLKTKEMLEKSWKDDMETQEKYRLRDQETVDEFGHLLERTGKREEKISSITGQLEVELGYLSSFLDNLASRRPTDSRESQRPLSQEGRLSRVSSRSLNLQEAVAEANMAEDRKSIRSRPHTSKSGKSVVISEEVTELGGNRRMTRTPTKID